jgi:cysteine-rich repeat protein
VLSVLFGDECAVRLGLATQYDDTAGDHPGIGTRVQADDGHFVGVTRPSSCGDTVLDPGEECDDGNHVNGACCAANCGGTPVRCRW